MRWLLFAVIGMSSAVHAAVEDYSRTVGPLISTHCSDCHDGAKAKGGIELMAFKTTADVHQDTARWEGVLHALRDHHMPPPKESTLSVKERDAMVSWISGSLEAAYLALPPNPGPPVLRRLTRAEYDRSIRDLLGVELNLSANFPPDGGGGEGFQNNADTLFVPTLLLEKLLAAAGDAIEAAPVERLGFVTPKSERSRDVKTAAQETAANFGLRAFRRPLNQMEVDRWVRVWDRCVRKGLSHEIGLRQMLRAMLSSPHFLYRVELQQNSITPYLVSSYEMASRLSYFLWGTMPDDELFALAKDNKLHEEDVIRAQVTRMLADPKARALTTTFAVQWLRLDPLREGAGPDPGRYPEYTNDLRESMIGEAAAFMHGLVQDDRSILDLIDSDYTWVDGRLARIYGFGGGGDAFRKVSLPDKRRGGVTGMAAVHAVTSFPGRTSLVLRGAWVLDRLLDSPPPPPPPNVEQLPREDSKQEALTLRQRLAQHRANPNCASCHDRIDPVGHPLEHFDPLGRWIDRDIRGEPIDPDGTLPDGTPINGPEALRKALMARQDRFTEAFCTKMLGYALGRGILPTDRPTISALRSNLVANDHRIRVLITDICLSFPFRHRSNNR